MSINTNKYLDTGGPDQSRTDDLFTASEALYQLSYGPVHEICMPIFINRGYLESKVPIVKDFNCAF